MLFNDSMYSSIRHHWLANVGTVFCSHEQNLLENNLHKFRNFSMLRTIIPVYGNMPFDLEREEIKKNSYTNLVTLQIFTQRYKIWNLM